MCTTLTGAATGASVIWGNNTNAPPSSPCRSPRLQTDCQKSVAKGRSVPKSVLSLATLPSKLPATLSSPTWSSTVTPTLVGGPCPHPNCRSHQRAPLSPPVRSCPSNSPPGRPPPWGRSLRATPAHRRCRACPAPSLSPWLTSSIHAGLQQASGVLPQGLCTHSSCRQVFFPHRFWACDVQTPQ